MDTTPHLDSPETSLAHGKIIQSKVVLKSIYTDWYSSYTKFLQKQGLMSGKHLEIGSGGGFLKDIFPDVITSDIMPIPGVDLQFSAEHMPFQGGEITSIFMLNVLHHIPDTEAFFKEANRVLKPGGIIFMVEPANTLFSRLIYKNFHHEPFNPEAAYWKFPSKGPLSDANGAIPWMIFKRDYQLFKEKFPELELELFQYHTPFLYLFSGGLSKPSLIPGAFYRFAVCIEKLFTPFFPSIALFQTIVVRKK